MFAVIFVVQPKKGQFEQYLDLAKVLKPELEKIDGFIDNERFASQHAEGRVLSLSTWRDEKSLIRWRTLAIHHNVQEKGRFEVFTHYDLSVGEVIADTHVPEGQTLQQQRLDETETGKAKAVTISELAAAARDRPASTDLATDLGVPNVGSDGIVDREVFESIYSPGKLLALAFWRTAAAADRWCPRLTPGGNLRHRRIRIVRAYGMQDRREAPQYYPAVQAANGAE
jgi:heme-degrading monooxygenase HmoA